MPRTETGMDHFTDPPGQRQDVQTRREQKQEELWLVCLSRCAHSLAPGKPKHECGPFTGQALPRAQEQSFLL